MDGQVFIIKCFTVMFFMGLVTCRKYNNKNATIPKEYNINLDLPEEERWLEVVRDYKDIAVIMNDAML